MSADENDAPDWYVDYFIPFGYSAEELRQRWAGLSESAREDYRRVLPSSPEVTS